jgi:hypothetical protein
VRERAPARARAHAVLLVLGGLYLAGVWLEGVGSTLPALVLPRTPLYFLQIAALFPHAAVNVIDFRAEGWLCKEHRWEELDTRPYFAIDPNDKENRFQRVMHFLRDNRPTMHAVDDYLVTSHAAGGHADGIPDDEPLGGIRVLSLRLPMPAPGTPLDRAERKPLSSYPKEVRKNFYYTPRSKRAERCGYTEPRRAPENDSPDEAHPTDMMPAAPEAPE